MAEPWELMGKPMGKMLAEARNIRKKWMGLDDLMGISGDRHVGVCGSWPLRFGVKSLAKVAGS